MSFGKRKLTIHTKKNHMKRTKHTVTLTHSQLAEMITVGAVAFHQEQVGMELSPDSVKMIYEAYLNDAPNADLEMVHEVYMKMTDPAKSRPKSNIILPHG